MIKQVSFLVFSIFVLFSLSSCEKKIEWNLQTAQSERIVVEGLITNENIFQEIKLSKLSTTLNETSAPVSVAQIRVFTSNSEYIFNEDEVRKGTYFSETKFIGTINSAYHLEILFNTTHCTATAYMLPVLINDSVTFLFDSEKNLYTFGHVPSPVSFYESAIYTVESDWTQLPGFDTVPAENKKSLSYFYTLKSIDANEIFAPQKQTVYFPKGTKITLKKYSLTDEHADFIRSMLFETEWTGGLFDANHANVKTNLSGGALGFFGASSVYSKKMIVE